MIEKKIYSDNPELQKHIHGKDEDTPESDNSLSKSLIKPHQDVPNEETRDVPVDETPVNEQAPSELPAKPDLKIAGLLLDAFGKESFERLRADGNFMVPFTDEHTSLEEWIAQSIRMLFKPEETDIMGVSLDQWIARKESATLKFQDEIAQLKERLETATAEKKQAENNYVIADSERMQLRKDLLSSIPAVYFIDRFLPRNSSAEAEKLAGMLKEEMDRPTEDYPHFVTGIIDGWNILQDAIKGATDDESGMETVHLCLTGLLEKIAGRSITQRRAILEIVAGICSAKFKIYKFISPEESLQVDPRIHSATALGGSTIREGVTFAVIRKDTMQTVKYAEIKV